VFGQLDVAERRDDVPTEQDLVLLACSRAKVGAFAEPALGVVAVLDLPDLRGGARCTRSMSASGGGEEADLAC
jgi:hypothetical protein